MIIGQEKITGFLRRLIRCLDACTHLTRAALATVEVDIVVAMVAVAIAADSVAVETAAALVAVAIVADSAELGSTAAITAQTTVVLAAVVVAAEEAAAGVMAAMELIEVLAAVTEAVAADIMAVVDTDAARIFSLHLAAVDWVARCFSLFEKRLCKLKFEELFD
jgi:hypothetical protein